MRTGSDAEFGSRREARAPKSLVEDEADLSDWVGALRTDSFRGKLTSDDEASEANRVRSRTGGRGGEKGRDSFPMKRRREGDSGEFRDSTRNHKDSFSKNSPTVRRFDNEEEGLSRRRNNGSRGGYVNANVNSWTGKRGGRGMGSPAVRRFDVGEEGFSRGGNNGSRGGNVNAMGKRGGRDMGSPAVRRFGDEEEGVSRTRNNGSRGGKRGGRDMGSGYARNGVQGVNDSRKQPRWMDGDDDVDELRGGIGDLLTEEDSDAEDDDDDGELLKESASSLFGSDKGASESTRVAPRSSPAQSDSYLSETRYVKMGFLFN
jgi:hypothetical protein